MRQKIEMTIKPAHTQQIDATQLRVGDKVYKNERWTEVTWVEVTVNRSVFYKVTYQPGLVRYCKDVINIMDRKLLALI